MTRQGAYGTDMWQDRYGATDDYVFGRAPAAVLVENPWIWGAATNALCVADGEGRNATYLAQQGLTVTAFDPAEAAVAKARALGEAAQVSVGWNLSDWDSWDWSHSFDLVVAIFIQFADPEFRAQQFADLKRAVRPGGRLFLHGYTPDQIALGTGGPKEAAHMYTEDLLSESFGDWKIERLAAYEREVQEGRGHVGRSALIDLVVQRPT